MVIILTTSLQCKKAADNLSSEKAILDFTLPQQIGAASIDQTFHFVTVVVAHGTDLTALKPMITISDKATIEPASGVATDFSQGPVTYKVTAEDGSEQDWMVILSAAKSNAAYILSFTVPHQVGQSVITDSTVNAVVDNSADLTKIAPTIVVSDGASVGPATGVEKDFSQGPVTYTVIAEDGITSKIYKATVTKN